MYQIHNVVINDGKDLLYALWEVASEQIIGTFFTKEEANKVKKFYTKGGGFNGFTPAFILHEAYKPIDIDDEFNAMLGDE